MDMVLRDLMKNNKGLHYSPLSPGALDAPANDSLVDDIGSQISVSLLIDLIPEAVLVADKAGNVVLANEQCHSFLGYLEHGLVGIPLIELITDLADLNDIRTRKSYFSDLKKSGERYEIGSSVVKRKDGAGIPCEISLSSINTGLTCFALYCFKETDKPGSEQHKSTLDSVGYEQLLENTAAVPWEALVESLNIVYVGSQVYRLLGYSRNEWSVDGFWASHFHPEDREKTMLFIERNLQKKDDFEVDFRMLAKDGRTVWINCIINVVRVAGEVKALRGYMVDITEKRTLTNELKSAIEELGKYKGRLESLFDKAPVGMCYLDPRLNVIHMNKYLADLNEMSSGGCIGKNANEVFKEEFFPEGKINRMLRDKSSIVQNSISLMLPNKEKLSLVVTYLLDKEGDGTEVGIRCIVVDATELMGLEKTNKLLREKVRLSIPQEKLVGQGAAIRQLLGLVKQVAPTDARVLIFGETGTGKELIARELHALSRRSAHNMITINCAALPATLIESELFGREKGAYTGALTKQVGRFEAAHQSTIFLDEIGELPLELQPKLLRVLQEGEFERLGGNNSVKVDVRIIAATNQDLAGMVKKGLFREDLYYRLSSFPVFIPPLRERMEDIPELVWNFIEEYNQSMGKRIEVVPKKAMQELIHHPWPGNIRELRNVIERSMILSSTRTLNLELSQLCSRSDQEFCKPSPTKLTKLQDVEHEHIVKVLDSTNWRIRGKFGAAELLGLKPTTLESRMGKFGIKRN